MESQRSFFDWFIDPIKNHYTDFEGRVGRQEFWMFVLVWLVISIGLALIGMVVGEKLVDTVHTLLSLAIFVPSIALGARRLHDTNRSGWWQLIGIIPFIGWVIIIVLLAQKSDIGPNQYGNEPTTQTGSEERDIAPSQTTNDNAVVNNGSPADTSEEKQN